MKIIAAFLPISVIFFVQQTAWGWGSYGHEQVNRAAVELLGNTTDVGQCMTQNKSVMERLAITPDYDWKNLGSKPPGDLQKMRLLTDHYEHPHHYFEADAFIQPPVDADKIKALPSGLFEQAFAKGAGTLIDLFIANEATIRTVNPDKFKVDKNPVKNVNAANPSSEGVAGADGSAPWRIYQLYNLAIDAWTKDDNPELALVYLGAMGHYVGDMSQPFHASLNFDGKYYNGKFYDSAKKETSPTEGIHHTFEEAILEDAYNRNLKADDVALIKTLVVPLCEQRTPHVSYSKDDKKRANPIQLNDTEWHKKVSQCISQHKAKADPTNSLWDSFIPTGFDATDSVVMGFLKNKTPEDIATSDVVKKTIALVASGYGTIQPLLDVFNTVSNNAVTDEECAPKKKSSAGRKSSKSPSTDDGEPDPSSPGKPGGDTGENTSARYISGAVTCAFRKASVPGTGDTVLNLADRRIADAAYLLASLWKSAFLRIKEINPQAKGCGVIFGNDLKNQSNYNAFLTEVITNYPFPKYIPAYRNVGFDKAATSRKPQSTKKRKKK